MKKLFTIISASSLIAACGQSKKDKTPKKKAETKLKSGTKASDKMMTFGAQQLFAYATEYGALENENPETNLVARQLYQSAIKYNYTFPGWPKDTQGQEASKAIKADKVSNYYNLKWTTGEDAKTAPEIAAKILKNWQKAGVKVGFIQTNPESKKAIVNGEKLMDAIKNKEYTGKLVITGKNTSHIDLYGGKKGATWSDYANVATFEFSQITTAYNAGYLTQSQFGKVKLADGTIEKRSVGYIVAAQEKDDNKWNKLQMKKANAFRKGVMDAVKEQGTGEATFVKKEDASDKAKEKKLMFESSDISKYFKVLKKLDAYKNPDHSFVYYAGADAEINDLVATELINSSVANKFGHKFVVETAGFDDKDDPRAFGEGENGSWSRGSGSNQVVTARVFMATKSWIPARVLGDKSDKKDNISSQWTDAQRAANAFAIEAVLSSLYGANNGKIDYFGKHTYIGAFPDFSRVGTNGIKEKAQKIDTKLLDKIRIDLYLKNIDIGNIEDDFLGSGL